MAKKSVTRNSIKKGFQEYLLLEGKAPASVLVFTKYLKITEEAFFEKFGSLGAIEKSIWEDYYQKTFDILQKDKDFEEMEAQEKHLSFLYTLLELIKGDRSYIQYRLQYKSPALPPKFLLVTQRVIDNADTDWMTPPRFIPKQGHDLAKFGYRKMLWKHSIAVIFFWANDDSLGSEDTDAFIEKSTRTLFDLGQIPALDSVIDLGKFFMQRMGFNRSAS